MAGPGTKAASGRRSISRRLTVSLAAAVLLSTLCALVFFSLSYREHEAEHLQAMADDYAGYLAQSLAVPVWELSEPTITAIGQAFAHNELVTRLVIVDERAQVLFRWDRDQAGPAVEQITPIMRQGRVIGTVELALGTEWVTREERRILSAAGLTVLLAVAVVTVLTGMLLRINLKKAPGAPRAGSRPLHPRRLRDDPNRHALCRVRAGGRPALRNGRDHPRPAHPAVRGRGEIPPDIRERPGGHLPLRPGRQPARRQPGAHPAAERPARRPRADPRPGFPRSGLRRSRRGRGLRPRPLRATGGLGLRGPLAPPGRHGHPGRGHAPGSKTETPASGSSKAWSRT